MQQGHTYNYNQTNNTNSAVTGFGLQIPHN